MHATGRETVVIVGAGLAGGNAAVTLRQEGWQSRILLLGSEPTIPFGRPPLSKTYLRGEEDLSGWYVKPADWYGEHDIELHTSTTVRRVDTAQRQLQLADGTALDYDRLMLCTGGSNRQLEVPGANLPGIYHLRSLAQCEAIRQAARPGAHAVIVGMGFIGAEVAASLRQMGLDVTALLPGAAPLASVLGHEIATVLASIHLEHGVHLLTNDQVIGFEGRERVEHVLTAKGARLYCDLVVVGIGIQPNVDALSGSAIALANGILVNAHCQTNIPHIFAAGMWPTSCIRSSGVCVSSTLTMQKSRDVRRLALFWVVPRCTIIFTASGPTSMSRSWNMSGTPGHANGSLCAAATRAKPFWPST